MNQEIQLKLLFDTTLLLKKLQAQGIHLISVDGKLQSSGKALSDEVQQEELERLAPALHLLLGNQQRKTLVDSTDYQVTPREFNEQPLTLTPQQQQLLTLKNNYPHDSAYHNTLLIRFDDLSTAEQALNKLQQFVSEFPPAQQCFRRDDYQNYQLCGNALFFPTAERMSFASDEILQELLDESLNRPFKLGESLLRFGLFVPEADCAEQTIYGFVLCHQIIADDFSLNLLLSQMTEQAAPIQPLDFEAYKRAKLDAVEGHQQKFWQAYLSGADLSPQLPAERSTLASVETRASEHLVDFPVTLQQAFQDKAERAGVSFYSMIALSLVVSIYYFSRRSNVHFVANYANREDENLASCFDYVAETFLVHHEFDDSEPLLEVLTQLDANLNLVQSFADYPVLQEYCKFNDITGTEHDLQVMLSYQSVLQDAAASDFPGRITAFTQGYCKSPLAVNVLHTPEDIQLIVRFDELRFAAPFREQWLAYWQYLIHRLGQADFARHSVNDIFLSGAELKISGGAVAKPAQTPAHYIVSHCAAFAGRIAVVDNDQKLTYEGLYALTARYHHHLIALFSDLPEQDSGRACVLVMRKSRHLLAFCLAANTAGGYFIIIDPADSDALITDKLTTIGDATIVCDDINRGRIRQLVGERSVLSVVNFADEIGNGAIQPVAAHKFMYGVFGSGTTGKPKLARNYHHSMFHLINTIRHLMPDDKSAFSLGSQGFDTSIKLLFAPLFSGHTVYLHHYDRFDPERILLDFAVSGAPTSACANAVLNSLLEHPYAPQCLSPMRIHFNGGEHWNLTHVRGFGALARDCTVLNAYGPSEATDIVLFSAQNESCIDLGVTPYRGEQYVPPLQYAVPGSEVYIVDEQLRPMPANCKGQLLIAGDCVGAGYSDSELSKQRFINYRGMPAYLSGDIAQISTVACTSRNGLPEVIIHGRLDDQIKINGIRVELSGLETQLQALLSPRKLAIRAFKDEQIGYFIVCYIQQGNLLGEPKVLVDIGEFLAPLQQKIDAPLIPRFWVGIADLPLTTNGKLNRKELPEFPLQALQWHMHQAQLSQQQDISVLQYVQTQLGIPINTEHDNLIMFGGDSIKMNRLKVHLEQRFSRRFLLAEMYESPTLSEILNRKGSSLPATSIPSQDKTQISGFEKQYLYLESSETGRMYQMCGGIALKTPLPQSKVKSALVVLLQQTEALRSQFDLSQWKKRLVGTDPLTWPKNWCEIANTNYQNFCDNALIDLVDGFPVRFMLAINEETRVQQIWIKVHHIAVDAYSLSLICDRLIRIFEGQPIHFDALQQWSQVDTVAAEDWRSLLTIPPITFRHGAEPQLQTHTRISLSPRHSARLESKAKAKGCNEFTVMLAAFAASLSILKSQHSLSIGVPISLRDTDSLVSAVGCFINTLPARLHLERTTSFDELIKQVQDEMTRLQQVKYTPLVDIKAALRSEQDLFNVMLVKHDEKLDHALLHNNVFTPSHEFMSSPRLDLTLHYIHDRSGLTLLYEYDPRISESDIRALHQILQSVLTQLEQGGQWQLRDCEIEPSDYFKPASLKVPDFIQQLVDHALYQPDAMALSTILVKDDHIEEINYQHLQQDVIAFAQQLSALPKGVISIVDERPLNVVLLQLAVLYSGNIFMVQNPQEPLEKRRKYQEQTECVAEICLKNHSVYIKLCQRLSPERQHQLAQQQANPKTRIAYLMTSSDMRGETKAAAIRYESFCYSTAYRLDYYQKDLERVLLVCPLAFDGAYAGLFGCLFSGGCVTLLDEQQRCDPEIVCDVMSGGTITQLLTTPVLYQRLLESPTFTAPSASVVVGGDVLSQKVVNAHYQRFSSCVMYNEYGPTENTIWSSVHRCQAGKRQKHVPIGTVLPGVHAIVLDDQLELVPYDQLGELYLAGDCLFAGYVNEAPEQAFTTVATKNVQGEFYATGDMVRMDAHGDLMFEARRSDFVKSRGYQVSPSEVATCLLQVNWVKEVKITNKDNKLLAIICTDIGLDDSHKKQQLTQKLCAHMLSKLPIYMLPQRWHFCNEFPLTANGKVDLIQLLSEFEQEITNAQHQQTTLDAHLAQHLKELLGVNDIQANATFFENGGDSIQLMEFSQYIEQHYQLNIPITILCQQPSLSAIQQYIFERDDQKAVVDMS